MIDTIRHIVNRQNEKAGKYVVILDDSAETKLMLSNCVEMFHGRTEERPVAEPIYRRRGQRRANQSW